MATRAMHEPMDRRTERLGQRPDFADWVADVTSALEERRGVASGVPKRRRPVSTPFRWFRAARDLLGTLAPR